MLTCTRIRTLALFCLFGCDSGPSSSPTPIPLSVIIDRISEADRLEVDAELFGGRHETYQLAGGFLMVTLDDALSARISPLALAIPDPHWGPVKAAHHIDITVFEKNRPQEERLQIVIYTNTIQSDVMMLIDGQHYECELPNDDLYRYFHSELPQSNKFKLMSNCVQNPPHYPPPTSPPATTTAPTPERPN